MNPARIYFTSNLKVLAIAFIVLLSAALILITHSTAEAATGIRRTINFQGKLVNTNGTNVANGNYSIVFSIYDVASSGTALWTETQSSVSVTDGVFIVELGSSTAFPADFNFNWDGRYLGVKVGSDAEMTPRIRLTAVPYAFNAERVAGLTVQDDAGNASTSATLRIANNKTVTISNGLTFSGADSKTINFGSNSLTFTTSADSSLTLPTSGTLTTLAGSEELTNKTIGSTGLTFSGASTDITTASNEDLTVTPNGTGNITLTGDFNSQVLVGASSATTEFALFVNNSIGSNASFVVNNINSSDLISASSSGTTKFNVTNAGIIQIAASQALDTLTAGSLGIGTTTANALTLGNSTVSTMTFNVDTSGNYVFQKEGSAFSCSGTDKLTLNGSGQLVCGTDQTGGSGSSNWTLTSANGTLSPNNGTVDLLVGQGTGAAATSSAKFAVLNLAGTLTPVASISAIGGSDDTKGVYISGNGSIQSVRNNTLTIGGSTTGNILLSPNNGTSGFITLDGQTDIGGASGIRITTAGTISDINGATVDVNDILNANSITSDAGVSIADGNSYTGAGAVTLSSGASGALTLNSASNTLTIDSSDVTLTASGITTISLGTSATINAGATALNLQADGSVDVNIAGGSGTTGCTIANSTGNLTCSGDILGSATGTQGHWNVASGAIFPRLASTLDFLLGSTATSTAKFAFTGLSDPNNVTQASISGQLIVMPNNGYSGKVGIGTTIPEELLDIQGGDILFDNTRGVMIEGTGGGNNRVLTLNSSNELVLNAVGTTSTLFQDGSVTNMLITGTGLVGLGTTSPTSELHVTRPLSMGATGKALAIFDQIENQDILSASSGGTTKFVIENDGDLIMTGGQRLDTLSAGALNIGTTTANALTLGNSTVSSTTFNVDTAAHFIFQKEGSVYTCSGTDKLTLNGSGQLVCGTDQTGGSGSSNWRLASGALSPINDTLDILIGANATTSAKFAFTGLSDLNNQTQASISGQLIVMPNNGYSGKVGIGTSSPRDLLHIAGSSRDLVIESSGGSGNRPGISGYQSRGSLGSETATQANDILLFFGGRGYGDTTHGTISNGAVLIKAGENFTDTARGAYLTFETTPLLSTTRSERLRIDPAGLVGLGTTAPVSQLQVTRALATGATGKALAVFNQIEDQDIFTASKGGSMKFVIDTDGRVGINTNSFSTNFEYLRLNSPTYTDTSGTIYMVNLQNNANPSSNSTAHFYGARNVANLTGSSEVSRIVGGYFQAYNNNTATSGNGLTEAFGGHFEVTNNTTGKISSANAGNFSSSNNSSGTISNLRGVRILRPTNSGTITNTYGVFIQDQTASSGTQTNTPYGIYQEGTGDRNYFASILGLGTATPISQLHVTRPLSSGALGKALAIFDQIENQDIFTASASGVTKFTLANDGSASMAGTLTLGGSSGIIRPADGDLLLQYKSGANTWASAIGIDDVTGAVGIGTTTYSGARTTVGGSATLTTSGQSLHLFTGTATSSQTDSRFISMGGVLNLSSSITNFYGLINLPSITDGGSGYNITNQAIANLGRIDLGSTYTGTVTTGIGFYAGTPSKNSCSGCTFTNYAGVDVANINQASTNNFGIRVGAPGIADDIVNTSENVGIRVSGGTISLGNQTASTTNVFGISVAQPTYTSTTNTRTIGTASSLHIAGAPIAGSNVTITNNSALTVATGNVGIGTTNPQAPLQIDGADNAELIRLKSTASTDAYLSITNQGKQNLRRPNGSTVNFIFETVNAGSWGAGGGGIVFEPNDVEAARFTTAGLMGLGTNSPSSALHVTHPLSMGATGKALAIFDQIESQDIFTASAGGTTIFTIENDGGIVSKLATSQIAQFNDGTNASAIWGTNIGLISELSEARITSRQTLPLVFFTGGTVNSMGEGTERMRLLTTGEFGIGGTPTSQLYVTRPLSFGATGKALAIFDQIESQDIFTASAGGTTRFVIANGGSVGVGTSLPGAKVDIVGASGDAIPGLKITHAGTNAASVGLEINHTGSNGDIVNIKDNGTTVFHINNTGSIHLGSGVSTTEVSFFARTAPPNTMNTNGEFYIGSTLTAATGGRIWLRANNVNYRFNAAIAALDYSEYLKQEDTSEPGDVMVLSDVKSQTVKRSDASYHQEVLGVVTQYGTGFADGCIDDPTCGRSFDPKYANVGMLGQVYTKVTTENGDIKPGDPLTTSSINGVAMKATKEGRILGYALDYFDGSKSGPDLFNLPTYAVQKVDGKPVGKIVILLQAGWFDPSAPPPDSIDKTNIAKKADGKYGLTSVDGRSWDNVIVAEEAAIANLSTGSIKTKELFVDGLKITGSAKLSGAVDLSTIKPDSGSVALLLSEKDGKFTIRGNDKDAIVFDSLGNATFAGTITAAKIKADQIDGLEFSIRDQVINMKDLLGLAVEPSASESSKLSNTTSESTGIIASVKNLFEGMVEFLGRVIFRNSVEFEGEVAFNSDTAGYAEIKKGQKFVDVVFDKEYENQPVVNVSPTVEKITNEQFNKLIEEGFCEELEGAPVCQDKITDLLLSGEMNYVILDETTKGFRIFIDDFAPIDVKFSWQATAVKNVKTVMNNGPSNLILPYVGNYQPSNKFGEHSLDTLIRAKDERLGLKGHDGLDIPLPSGSSVLAVDDGEVDITNSDYGITIYLKHTWGRTVYGHLSERLVKERDKVAKGEKIALSGNSGLSTGPHLHFGISLNSSKGDNGYAGFENPLHFLSFRGSTPTVAGVSTISASLIPSITPTPMPVENNGFNFQGLEGLSL